LDVPKKFQTLSRVSLSFVQPVGRGNKNSHSSTYYMLESYLKYFWYYYKGRSDLGL